MRLPSWGNLFPYYMRLRRKYLLRPSFLYYLTNDFHKQSEHEEIPSRAQRYNRWSIRGLGSDSCQLPEKQLRQLPAEKLC